MEHDIKHFGTFGSPKIAKHVHFGQWEHGNVDGNLFGNMGVCMSSQ